MIPTVILVGMAVRQWWIVFVAALLWPMAVVMWGDVDSLGGLFGSGLLGAVNAAFGVTVGTAIQKLAAGLWTSASSRSR